MAKTVATSLTKEDLDLLDKIPGSSISEKLRTCIRRTVEENPSGPAAESRPQEADEVEEKQQKSIDDLTNQVSALKEELKEAHENRSNLEEEMESGKTQLEQLEEENKRLEAELQEVSEDRKFWLEQDTDNTQEMEQLEKENDSLKSELQRYRSAETREAIHGELDAMQKAYNASQGFGGGFYPSEFGPNLKKLGYDWSTLHDVAKSDLADSLFKGKAEVKISDDSIQELAKSLGITVQELERHRTHVVA